MTFDIITDNIRNTISKGDEDVKKRERVLAAIRNEKVDAVPVGFSLHFNEKTGAEAVKAHLEFFEKTDTDIIKIMNEHLVPDVGEIRRPDDWNKIPVYSMKSSFM